MEKACQTEAGLEQVLELAHEAVVAFAEDGRVVSMNPACERLTGYSIEELRDGPGVSTARSLMPKPGDLDGAPPYLTSLMCFSRKVGKPVTVDAAYVPLHGSDGRLRTIIGFFRESIPTVGSGEEPADPVPLTLDLRQAVESDNKSLDEILEDVERRAIVATLRFTGGHRGKAAKRMRISRSRLYRRLDSLDIL